MTKRGRGLSGVLIAILTVLLALLFSTDGRQIQTPKRPNTPNTPTTFDALPLAKVPANDLAAIKRIESDLQIEGKYLYARQQSGMRYYYYFEELEENDSEK